jgi:XTP/dITP diphosphohydrolase
MKVVVASRNHHKVREISVILAETGLSIETVPIDVISPLTLLIEDEPTFEGNALAKARQAASACGLPAIADDSGIEVDALGGAPGVRSARWSGEPCDDTRNNQRMLQEMALVSDPKRTARYRCAAAYIDLNRGIEMVRSGSCEGEILFTPRGTGGFGYDPLFFLPTLGKTMAEITLEEKNRLSHRAAAFRALARSLGEIVTTAKTG